ncbi:MAG TPA: MoxR family ATPase [Acidimicrobiales bacterium]|nr:MoxR family ATPase [Acidimicrobiales bacterium]
MTRLDSQMPDPATDDRATTTFGTLETSVAAVVATTPRTIRLAVACVAAGGHLLVEDHPGLGKTTLAKALAGALGLGFHRLQCTADLLPADVVGATVLGPDGTEPTFRPGPVFTNVLMADELNRASPRSQSALLEAMEEHQVSVDGVTRALPVPFFVLATQNPFDATGTSPLPHGQRDRFLVRLMLGYPSRPQMDAMLAGPDPADTVRQVRPSVTPEEFHRLMEAVAAVHVAPPVRSYVLDLVESTRVHPLVAVGASPRAALALIRVSSALAVASGRSFVTPDDVQEAAVPSLAHRLLLRPGVEVTGGEGEDLVAEVTSSIAVPLRGD